MTSPHLTTIAPVPDLPRFRGVFLIIGIALLLACVPGWIMLPKVFYSSYLFAWIFWLGVSLGALAIVMLHHLTGGHWGFFVRRFGEAAGMTMLVMPILFIPIFLGLKYLYPWHPSNPEFDNPFVQHRHSWFTPLLWSVRWLIILGVFIWMAWRLRGLSLRHDLQPSARITHTMYSISARGLVIYFVLMSLGSVDWIMSRIPEWRSTMFGFIIILGQCVSGLCLLILMLGWFARSSPLKERVGPNHFNDIGNLLLTCVILWAYCAFAQLLVTYLGNTQGEITWYMPRIHGPWHAIAALLIVFHFLVPFFLLLMRGIKRSIPAIMWLCAGLFLIRMFDVFWIVIPTGQDPGEPLPWEMVALSLGLVVGIGGIWMAFFFWLLEGRSVLPLGYELPLRPVHVDEDEDEVDETWEQTDETRPGPAAGPVA